MAKYLMVLELATILVQDVIKVNEFV